MKTSSIRRYVTVSLVITLPLLFVLPSLNLSTPMTGRTASATNGASLTSPEQAGCEVCAVQFCTATTFYTLSVKGSWVLPKIASCPPTGTPTATYEVGMDLTLNAIDVENGGGVIFGCTGGGTPFYDAWVSEAGAPLSLSHTTNPVFPGDHMTATITYSPITNMFTHFEIIL